MRGKILILLSAAAGLSLFGSAGASRNSDAGRSPLYGLTLPPGYRNWQVISVAHEAEPLDDLRVVLGNDIAMRAFRKNIRPFPDGTVIARLAYRHEPSAQNNAIFGREQSFVAGEPTNVQIEAKDSRRFRSSSGWGYAQFEAGRPNPSTALAQTCVACHRRLPEVSDLVFTKYAP